MKSCKFASVPQFTLAENVTCFAYDFYTHVSAMEAELCTCDPNYNKVAAIKYTTEQVVKNACYWVSEHKTAAVNCMYMHWKCVTNEVCKPSTSILSLSL